MRSNTIRNVLFCACQKAPTPRTDRISRDYAQEYPNIEVEGRHVASRTPGRQQQQHNMDNVKLNEEEADSDDEWEALVEASDPEAEQQGGLALLRDSGFVTKLRSRIKTSSDQVKQGGLEGASKLRTVLRVTLNLLTVKW